MMLLLPVWPVMELAVLSTMALAKLLHRIPSLPLQVATNLGRPCMRIGTPILMTMVMTSGTLTLPPQPWLLQRLPL